MPVYDSVNKLNIRSVYPTAPGQTTAQQGTAGDRPRSASGPAQAGTQMSEVERASAMGGSPVVWLISLMVLLAALMWASQRFGASEDYRNLRLSAYNIFVVGTASLIFFSIAKVLATKYKVPGVSPLILAA